MSYVIRDLESFQEATACAQLQREVWAFETPDVVTATMLESIGRRGGIVLGAFDGDGSLVGFVFSFPACLGTRPIQHSHMLAVREGFRNTGIGQALKFSQRRRASQLGQSLMTWTFDPLESKNGHLNLNRLGVVVNRYYINLYGQKTTSQLHSGLGTDRFLAEWEVAGSVKSSSKVAVSEAVKVLSGSRTRAGWIEPQVPVESCEAPLLSVEVPYQIQALKRADHRLAMEWRLATRSLFPHYLSRGYQVRRLETFQDGVGKRSAYLLFRTGQGGVGS